jgi:UDP-3-O-[3-hydroxymyristoyl] glucosamine N-acyltransferase
MDYVKKRRSYPIDVALKKSRILNYKILGKKERNFFFPSNIWDAKKGAITFCSKQKVKDPSMIINKTKASIVLVDNNIDSKKIDYKNKTIVLIDNPRLTFIRILNCCFPPEKKRGVIHPSSQIDKRADIHPSVYIGPFCVLGKCSIQENSVIYPNVIINDKVKIGRNVIINPGCVIGYDGFGYARNERGAIEKFPHYGGVIIEDNVELGSSVSIDRGTLGDTIIKKGAKIDNFSHIAHNVIVGKHSLVIAHAMIGGSTELGDFSWIAPSAALREGIKIGRKTMVGLGAVVTKDVPDNTVVVGNPAMPLELFKKNQEFLTKLIAKMEQEKKR